MVANPNCIIPLPLPEYNYQLSNEDERSTLWTQLAEVIRSLSTRLFRNFHLSFPHHFLSSSCWFVQSIWPLVTWLKTAYRLDDDGRYDIKHKWSIQRKDKKNTTSKTKPKPQSLQWGGSSCLMSTLFGTGNSDERFREYFAVGVISSLRHRKTVALNISPTVCRICLTFQQ